MVLDWRQGGFPFPAVFFDLFGHQTLTLLGFKLFVKPFEICHSFCKMQRQARKIGPIFLKGF
jgi:hypothetical protein